MKPRTLPGTFGTLPLMSTICPHCQSAAGVGRDGPPAAHCPACGRALPSNFLGPVAGEARIFDDGSGDVGLPLKDGAVACPVAFGPYRVLGLIGKGGMGLVYHARHEQTGEEVAVKTVRVRKRGMLHRIRREIHALARIEHPGLVRIIETGQSEGLPWYAMELLKGTSLHDRLAEIRRNLVAAPPSRLEGHDGETRADFVLALQPGAKAPRLDGLTRGTTVTIGLNSTSVDSDPVTLHDIPLEERASTLADLPLLATDDAGPENRPGEPAEVSTGFEAPVETGLDADRRDFLILMAGLCEALSYLHAEGIVHRDIKPQNVIIRDDGSPVLLDFGLASYFGAGGREALEVGGKIEGTPEYMSPEQIRGEYVDARADLYSVGCILYEGLTGKVPFQAPTPGGVLRSQIKLAPTPPRDLRPEIPEPLERLILGLLAKRVGDRLGYARDILATLEKVDCGSPCGEAARRSRDYLYRPGFVGRGPTLTSLEKHVRRVLGRPGHCIFLRGQSGVGKTRFSMESARQFEQGGLTVVTGECLPIGVEGDDGPSIRATPLHPFRPFLQMIADCCVEGGPEIVERLLGPTGGVLVESEPTLASLPGLAKAPPCSADDAEGALQSRLIAALGQALEAFAKTSPIVLFIDDLQWADALTLHFLALFHVGVWDSPGVAIIASFRSEETDAAIKEYLPVFQDATFVDLGPLEEPSLGAIVHDMLGSNLADDRFVRHLARRSNGNPFFVAEYLRAAVAEGLLSRDDSGCWRPKVDHSTLDAEALDASIPLPDSLHELVVRRLSGLSEDARTLLELASTVGRQVDSELIEAINPLGETRTMAGVEALLVAQVLEERRDGVYRFTHDMLREVAYGQIAPERRRSLHRTVAQALEARFVKEEERSRHSATFAHHWYRSIGDRQNEPEAVDRAVHYLQRSTRQALHAGLPAGAVDFGLAAARLLGVVLPKAPASIARALKVELVRIDELLNGRSPAELANLAGSTDPAIDRSIELLISIQPPAFLSNQLDLFALVACKNLSATLENGLGPLAPSVFALYALVERIVLDDARTARAYGSLAVELDRRSGGTQTADVLFLKGWFVDHWVAPLREILADCDLGARAGMASGEILYGSYNHGAHVSFLAASGEPLNRVIEEADTRLAVVGRRVIVARFHCVLERQFARALAGLTEHSTSLTDDHFDESRDLAFICQTTNSNQVGFYHVARLKLHYYQGEYDQALIAAERAETAAGSFARQPAEVDLVFFRALASLAMARENPEYLEIARLDRDHLDRWRADSEANFAHKLQLVDAEIARVEARPETLRLYEQAIQSAKIDGYPHHAALALELLARSLREFGQDDAEIRRQAIEGYRAWGASTLVERLARIDGPTARD